MHGDWYELRTRGLGPIDTLWVSFQGLLHVTVRLSKMRAHAKYVLILEQNEVL